MAEAGGIDKKELRILRLLSRTAARFEPASASATILLDGGEQGIVAARQKLVDDLAGRGLIELKEGIVSISDAGRRHLAEPQAERRHGAGDGRKIELVEIAAPDGPIVVPVNLAESPLGMLARRRGRDGRPFLSGAEWRAGERFRADYTRGQIMPRLGANWVAAVSSGKRAGGGGVAELTDAALGARFRVEKAIEAVGPELSGVLVDICCFLKGLELVETERGWPVRSAKVVLKAALGALARHYEPGSGVPRQAGHALHWGAEGYRPAIRGGQSRE